MSSAELDAPARDRLLAAAFELIDADTTLSMDAVAHASGVSRATAYRTFAGIREMVAALTELQARFHADAVVQALQRQRDEVAKLETIAVYTVTTARDDLRLRRLMPQVGMATDSLVQQLAAEVSEPVIVAGQAAGRIRDDVSPAELTVWLLDCFVGGTAYRHMSETQARTLFRTFFLPGLVPATGAARRTDLEPIERHLRQALEAVETARGARR